MTAPSPGGPVDISPTLRDLAESAARGEGWVAYCTDCDTGSRHMTRAEAEVWPTLHRVLSPTCRPTS